MNRAEIIEGVKEVYYRLYALTDHRKTLAACLALLENENALIDRVLEITDAKIRESLSNTEYIEEHEMPIYEALTELRAEFLTLRGGEQKQNQA